MIQAIKAQLASSASILNADFKSKEHSEYEVFAQGYDYTRPSINLIPIRQYSESIDLAGATRYKVSLEVYFLTKFSKTEDDFEDVKDAKIQDMVLLASAFYKELHANKNLLFAFPQWAWRSVIIRQYSSNLLCGVKANIDLDTACNRTNLPEPLPAGDPVNIYFNGSFIEAVPPGGDYEICLVNSEDAQVGEIIDEISSTNQQASLEQENEFEIIG